MHCWAGSDGGRFAVSYLGHTSAPIRSTASAAEVEQALLALPTLHGVSVGFTGSNVQACSSPPNVIRVTFTHDFGDVPPLELETHAMPNLTTAATGELKTTTHALVALHEPRLGKEALTADGWRRLLEYAKELV